MWWGSAYHPWIAPTLRPTVTQYHLSAAATVRPIGGLAVRTGALRAIEVGTVMVVGATTGGTIEAGAVVPELAAYKGLGLFSTSRPWMRWDSITRESTLEFGLLRGDGRGREVPDSLGLSARAALVGVEGVSKVKVTDVEVRVVETEGSSGAYSCVVVWWTREFVTPVRGHWCLVNQTLVL
jgi:hypothetical protein